MKTYQIDKTDLTVTRLGYGCMNIGGSWDSAPLTDENKEKALRAVFTAYDAGVNLFDHADIYCKGKAEEVFAEVWKARPGLRDKMVIQSKCGIRFKGDPDAHSPSRYDFSAEHILRSVEDILKRLQTDYLDVLLLHRPDPLVEPEEVAQAFDTLKQDGKVRYFGLSNHTVMQTELLRQFVNQPLVVNQLEVSLIHNHLITEGVLANQTGNANALATGILDYCRLNRITVQAWSSLAGGKITNPKPDASQEIQATARLVQEMAEDKQTSPEAILLAWLLRHPAQIQPIMGTTNPQRIQACCAADSVELTREEWYSLLVSIRGADMP